MKKGLFLLVSLLSACAIPPSLEQNAENTPGASTPDHAPVGDAAILPVAKLFPTPLVSDIAATDVATTLPPQQVTIFPGTASFTNTKTLEKTRPITQTDAGDITLSFEGADIRDVIKVVFETLKENYTIDPQVQGEITVQTGRPLSRDQIIPTLEALLRINNAVLVRENGMNRIVPATGAIRQSMPPTMGRNRSGYGVRIVPLQYISATEMQALVAPLLPEGGVVRADVLRNLLILAGTTQELANVQSTIDTFDVNWLKGMSVGMFRLRNIDSQSMVNNLNQMFGEGSGTPVAGLMRFVPLSKINAVIVITPQVEYLKEIGTWVDRLDGVSGERLYVYPVQHSRADYVSELLNSLFNLGNGGGGARGGETAPGLKPTQLSGGAGGASSTTSSAAGGSGLSAATKPADKSAANTASRGSSSSMGNGGPSAGMEEVRIVADTENNSLLIWATRQNYDRILNTLEKMDVTPRQVLIEATIAEVTLTGELKYGLQWFFNHDVGTGGNREGSGAFGLPGNLAVSTALSSIPAGKFSYAIADNSGGVKTLLNALASDSKIKVLSSPQIMVVDNQQAMIRVGTQQPIPAPSTVLSSGVQTSGGVTYKDTGVMLDVLPRINAGGMVNLEIKQEVVDVGNVDSATSQRSFLQRSVSSKVVIRSGQTVVLGGLIRDNRTDGQGGIPGLYKLPLVGPLFGNTQELLDRTELIVLITPQVVQDSDDAARVTEEMKRKMQEVVPLLHPAPPKPPAPAAAKRTP